MHDCDRKKLPEVRRNFFWFCLLDPEGKPVGYLFFSAGSQMALAGFIVWLALLLASDALL